MNNLTEILKNLIESRKETGLSVSDEVIFDCAIRILNTNHLDVESKDKEAQKPFNPASEAQKRALQSAIENGLWKGDINKISKGEAFKVIKALKEGETF